MSTMKSSKPSKPSKRFHDDAAAAAAAAGSTNIHKNVGFASSPVISELRPPTHGEDWSLYYFESHVQSCKACYSPSKKNTVTAGNHHQQQQQQQKEGRVLCKAGQELARQVIALFYRHEGNTYSTLSTPDRMVQVEIPKRYKDCRNLLKTVARGAYPYTTISPHGNHGTLADIPYNVEERRPAAATRTKHTVKLHQDHTEAKPLKSTKVQAPTTEIPSEHPATQLHIHSKKHHHGQRNTVDWPDYHHFSTRKPAGPRVYVHNDKENSRSRSRSRKNDDDAHSTCAVVGSRGYSFANKARLMDSFEVPVSVSKPKGYSRQEYHRHRHPSSRSGYHTEMYCSDPYCPLAAATIHEPVWSRRDSTWPTSYYL